MKKLCEHRYVFVILPLLVSMHDISAEDLKSSLSSAPENLLAVGEYLYLSADDGIHGRELWRINSENELQFVADFEAGPGSSNPRGFNCEHGKLYVAASLDALRSKPVDLIWEISPIEGVSKNLLQYADYLPPANSISFTTTLSGLYAAYPISKKGRELVVFPAFDSNALKVIDTIMGPHDGLPYSREDFGRFNERFLCVVQGLGNSDRRIMLSAIDDPAEVNPLLTSEEQYALTFGFPIGVEVLGDYIYIASNYEDLGIELWRSDGTVKGTKFIKDINPGTSSSFPTEYTELKGVVYFRADDGEHGIELWRTDGTSKGTWMVKDIYPGIGDSNPYNLCATESLLFFSATTEAHGNELWCSDGTPEGTRLVKDIYPGANSCNLYYPIVFEETLIFSAEHPQYGEEMWRSDGTEEGTYLIADIAAGALHSEPYHYQHFMGALYFSANDGIHGEELWATDGTEEGTRLVADINQLKPWVQSSNPRYLQAMNDQLFFIADSPAGGEMLWRHSLVDNTYEAIELSELVHGASRIDQLIPYHEMLYMVIVDEKNIKRLLSLDIKKNRLVSVTLSDELGSQCAVLRVDVLDEYALIYLRDENSDEHLLKWSPENNRVEESLVITNLLPGTTFDNFALFENNIYLSAQNENAETRHVRIDIDTFQHEVLPFTLPRQLNKIQLERVSQSLGVAYKRDFLWAYLSRKSMIDAYTVQDEGVYFSLYAPPSGNELWKTNAGLEEAVILKDCFVGTGSGSPRQFMELDAWILFTADHASKGRELWATKGTPETTYVVNEWSTPGTRGSSPVLLSQSGNRVLMSHYGNGVHKGNRVLAACELQDGKPNLYGAMAGMDHAGLNPQHATILGDWLYFSGFEASTGQELWRYNLKENYLALAKNLAQETRYTNNFVVRTNR